MPKHRKRSSGGRDRLNTRIARPVPNRMRIAAFGIVTVAVLGLAAYLLWPVVKPEASAPANVIAMQISMAGHDPSELQGRVGEPVSIRFINQDNKFHTDGGGWHQFAIDDLGIDVKIAPLETKEFTFTPTIAGTFEFYCDVCCGGRENPYMVGTLTVTG